MPPHNAHPPTTKGSSCLLVESEAIKAKETAEQELANKDATLDYAKAASQLAEAVARLKTIQKLRKKQ